MYTNFNEDFKTDIFLKFYVQNLKIGLDIDDVCADFLTTFQKKYNHNSEIKTWNFTYKHWFGDLLEDKEFWVTLPTKINPEHLLFLPTCYISKRTIDITWTEEWLEQAGFPCMPVVHVKESKVQTCKDFNLDYFVDDSFTSFQELNANGIKTFLFDMPHNKKFQVGNYRISNLNDIITRV